MTVTECEAVYVDCDPGFPLTIRLHQTEAAREVEELGGGSVGGSVGYPVIDTTGRMGLLCSGGTDQTAVNMICRMLGHKQVTLHTPHSTLHVHLILDQGLLLVTRPFKDLHSF